MVGPANVAGLPLLCALESTMDKTGLSLEQKEKVTHTTTSGILKSLFFGAEHLAYLLTVHCKTYVMMADNTELNSRIFFFLSQKKCSHKKSPVNISAFQI